MFDKIGTSKETFRQIKEETSIADSSAYKIRSKAISRGWKPGSIIEPEHVDDAPRSGRPKISTALALFIMETMTKNSTTRGWSCRRIAQEVSSTPGWQSVSVSTVYRTLRSEGYGCFKRTIKPGLTDENKEQRLKWCLEHRWSLEKWKSVIWTDETSMVLGGVRGKRRIWRQRSKAHYPHVVARRWKGRMEMIWWSCFSYNKKGPYYIWKDETAAEKRDGSRFKG